MAYTKMQTRWEVNKDGDLIGVASGDPAWTTIARPSDEFPMSAERVASLMNYAFKIGADAKQSEMKSVLGLGNA